MRSGVVIARPVLEHLGASGAIVFMNGLIVCKLVRGGTDRQILGDVVLRGLLYVS